MAEGAQFTVRGPLDKHYTLLGEIGELARTAAILRGWWGPRLTRAAQARVRMGSCIKACVCGLKTKRRKQCRWRSSNRR